jgi:hypothetical protein
VAVVMSGSVATSRTLVCPGEQNGTARLGDPGIRTIFHRQPIIGSRRPQGRVKLREYAGKPGKAAAAHRIEPRRPSDEAQRPAADGVHVRYGAVRACQRAPPLSSITLFLRAFAADFPSGPADVKPHAAFFKLP